MNITVVIADDHPLVRLGLTSILSKGGIEVTAEAEGGRSLLGVLEDVSCDVILTDLHMPNESLEGAALVKALLQAHPARPVVIIAGTAPTAVLGKLWRVGAKGIVGKEDPDEELVRAVRAAASGGSYCSTRLAKLFAARDLLTPTSTTQLSQGEREVITLIASGFKLEEIGRIRDTSPKTTARQKVDAFCKLGVRGTREIHEYVREFPEVLCGTGVAVSPCTRV